MDNTAAWSKMLDLISFLNKIGAFNIVKLNVMSGG